MNSIKNSLPGELAVIRRFYHRPLKVLRNDIFTYNGSYMTDEICFHVGTYWNIRDINNRQSIERHMYVITPTLIGWI